MPTKTKAPPMILVTFRGHKTEVPLVQSTTVLQVKEAVVAAAQNDDDCHLSALDIKLLFKGKVLSDNDQDLFLVANRNSGKAPKTVHLMALGLSQAERERIQHDFEQRKRNAPRIRDDLTEAGLRDLEERKQKGRARLQMAAARANGVSSSPKYGFGRIETLPNLPNEPQAREILETLANDPGILACMAKHQWNVGALVEMYPEGKVGQSAVCVMGLNQNKGQRIQLRIRTDDLKGFRKMLSIRKVLFHELAHNVHSEHNQDFFVLMRQIEKECNELDWTQGEGLEQNLGNTKSYQGGTYRLGAGRDEEDTRDAQPLSHRELALRAALQRMTPEEEEIEQGCACGHANFLPKEPSRPENNQDSGSDDMDLSP